MLQRMLVTAAIVGFPFYMVGMTAICTIVAHGVHEWLKGLRTDA